MISLFQYCKPNTILDSNSVKVKHVRPLDRLITLVKFDEHVIIREGFVSVNVFAIMHDTIITLVSC